MSIDWRRDREEFRWLAGLAAITLVTFVLAVIVGARAGVDATSLILLQDQVIWTAGPVPIVIAGLAVMIAALLSSRKAPFEKLRSFLRSQFGSPALVAASLLPILLVQILVGSFGVLKMLMQTVRPFAWDDTFASMDRALFLGHQPWQITHALFGSPVATHLIDSIYTAWIALLFTTVLFFALFASRGIRAKFFLAFSATWLLVGVVAAYAFASAGPCYAALIGAASAPDFSALMLQLHAIDAQHPLIAVRLQSMLWDAHVADHYALGMGISAMPSMHNAIALLYLLAVQGMGRTVRAVSLAFTVIVFVGSVHLGWHYAVDGLLAYALAWLTWRGAGAYLVWCGYAGGSDETKVAIPEEAAKPAVA
jgi:hypothetical protein